MAILLLLGNSTAISSTRKADANENAEAESRSSFNNDLFNQLLDDNGQQPEDNDPGTTQNGQQPLDDDLLQRLLGDQPGDRDGDEDPLERAIRGMRNAQQRIVDRDTGQETRDIQARVVKDLEELIERAKQRQPSPDQSPSPQPSQEDTDQEESLPDDEEQQTEESQDLDAESDGSGQGEEDKARESTDETREADEREAELARRREMVKDVWGHLPPAMRERLLNVSSQKYLPKYDDLVRSYFEALAEQGYQSDERR